jgi:hypothetical protein
MNGAIWPLWDKENKNCDIDIMALTKAEISLASVPWRDIQTTSFVGDRSILTGYTDLAVTTRRSCDWVRGN